MAAAMLASSVKFSRNIFKICRQGKNVSFSLRNKHGYGPSLYQGIIQGRSVPLISYSGRSIFVQSKGRFHTSIQLLSDIEIVKTPGFPESVSEGDIQWEKEVGDSVQEDDVIGNVETDKVSIPVPAPVAGVIEALLVPDGEKVTAGMDLVKIKRGEGASSPPPASKPAESPASAPSPPPSPPAASEAAPIPTTPPPVPPVPTQPMSSIPAASVKPTPVAQQTVTEVQAGTRGESRVKMNRMRQRIAQRLKDAQNTCAMLTTFNEIDMSNIMEMRKTYKDAFLKKHNFKLGFMSAFIKASAYALQDQPSVNAVIDETEIVYRDYVDVSIAVATPKGLVVPVLRGVEGMNYAQIERGLVELSEKAKSGQLAIEDMDGGTFTISNGGVFGSMFGTPIINPPQSAILGMHGVFDRPMAINGKVEIRPMMYVALTYDHRLIDGREAVTFLRKVKSAVEDPRVLLLDL